MLARIINTVGTTLNIDKQILSIDSRSSDFDEWDSLGHLQIILELEDEFKIRFKSSEIPNLISIQNIFSYIQAEKNGE